MKDKEFAISRPVAGIAAATLALFVIISYGVIGAIYAGYFSLNCCGSIRAVAYLTSIIVGFGTASLFYIRKIYLILFRNADSETNGPSKHDLPFLIYVLLRPIFGSLVSLLFLVSVEALVRSAVIEPTFSEGLITIALVSSVLLSAVLGLAIDMLPRAGKKLAARIGETSPNG